MYAPPKHSLHSKQPDPPRLNRYTCERCRGTVITIDREEGVTPFMVRCRADVFAKGGCGAFMVSSFYRDVEGVPTFEWRKPTKAEYRKYSPEMRDHVDQGGLCIYPIKVKP